LGFIIFYDTLICDGANYRYACNDGAITDFFIFPPTFVSLGFL